jgi:hypothetical protein
MAQVKQVKNPKEDAGMHMFTEAAALLVIAPVTAYIAYANPQIPAWQRAFLYGTAVVTFAVDGYLLAKWLRTP